MAKYSTEQDFRNAIIQSISQELQNEPLFSVDDLANKVDDAIAEFKVRRGYDFCLLTDEQKLEDMCLYYATIKKVALTWYNRIGAEGESYHYENTVHRSMWTDDELFGNVFSFVKVL